jgi:RNA polymerase sigma-B factor
MNAVPPIEHTGHPSERQATQRIAVGREARLFQRFDKTRSHTVRNELIHKHEALARYLATKFAGRGEPIADLEQVAYFGLIKAVDRFDPTRDVKFVTYATATIVGEIQRYFRDMTWRVKVPRSLLELNQRAARVKEELTSRLGRVPTVAEVAKAIGASEEATLEAMELSSVYSPVSLDSSTNEDAEHSSAERIGERDPRLESIVDNDDINTAIGRLDAREQKIIVDYYFNELSEQQIARKLCISQMHVSRLKKRALATLKEHLGDCE